PVIELNRRDVERLAKHFDLSFKQAREKFTKSDADHEYLMRRKADEHYGKICRFFDTEKRRCTIYTARPSICRQYPGDNHCGYYESLKHGGLSQEAPEHVASTWNA